MKKLLLSIVIISALLTGCSKGDQPTPTPAKNTVAPILLPDDIIGKWKQSEYFYYKAKLSGVICDSSTRPASSISMLTLTVDGTWSLSPAGYFGNCSYNETSHEITLSGYPTKSGDAPMKLFYELKTVPFDTTITPSVGSFGLKYIYWNTDNSIPADSLCDHAFYMQSRWRKQ